MTTFSAADSALGYLYQVRVALLWSLRRARTGTDFLVSLETLDDVTFESLQATGSKPDELLQTKHHRKSEASLTDASGDLWKSLRVWFEGRANNTIPSDAALYLLTTGASPKDGAAWFLRGDGARDVAKALQKLETLTQTSESEANAPAYKAFLAVTGAARRAILDDVVVLDRAHLQRHAVGGVGHAKLGRDVAGHMVSDPFSVSHKRIVLAKARVKWSDGESAQWTRGAQG